MQLSRDSPDRPDDNGDRQQQTVLLVKRTEGPVARRVQLRLAGALTHPRRSGPAHVLP
jgi:hypothetical protein